MNTLSVIYFGFSDCHHNCDQSVRKEHGDFQFRIVIPRPTTDILTRAKPTLAFLVKVPYSKDLGRPHIKLKTNSKSSTVNQKCCVRIPTDSSLHAVKVRRRLNQIRSSGVEGLSGAYHVYKRPPPPPNQRGNLWTRSRNKSRGIGTLHHRTASYCLTNPLAKRPLNDRQTTAKQPPNNFEHRDLGQRCFRPSSTPHTVCHAWLSTSDKRSENRHLNFAQFISLL